MDNDKLAEFLDSYDFMRLGQAIDQKNQYMAMMLVTNLQKAAENVGAADVFDMNFKGIRQCIIGGDVKQAQDILAVVTAKRVKMISELNDKD